MSIDLTTRQGTADIAEFRALRERRSWEECRRLASDKLRHGSVEHPAVWTLALQMSLLCLGKFEEADDFTLGGAFTLKDSGDAVLQAKFASNHGMILQGLYELTGEERYLDSAISRFTEAGELAKDSGDVEWQASVNNNLALAFLSASCLSDALRYAQKAVRGHLELEAWTPLVESLDTLQRVKDAILAVVTTRAAR